jgi:ribulose kinase
MIAAVSDGKYADFNAAVADCVSMQMSYEPKPTQRLERKYRRFCALYQAALAIDHID